MHIETDIKLDFSDVLLKPKRSSLQSRKDVVLRRKFKFKYANNEWEGIPIMASNLDSTGTLEMNNTLSKMEMLTCLHKFYKEEDIDDSINNEFIIPSIGIKHSDKYLAKVNSKFICIDVANGYCEYFVEFIKEIRNKYPDKIIIAGNVVTKEMTEQLILSGADIVKVGIGSGALCITRIKTGVGCPQLSAIEECADAAHGLGGHIISDGGCTCPGDVSKAFAAGADFVMLGSMLAGYHETGGDVIEEDGKKYKIIYGMSSDTAQNKYYKKVYKYRTSEGRTIKIPYKDTSVSTQLEDILGGLRSTCTYIGSKNIKHMSKCATFIRVNNQFNTMYSKN